MIIFLKIQDLLLIYLSKLTIISTNSETAMLSLECVIRTLLKCSRFSKVSTIVHSVSLYAPNVLSLKIKNLCLLIQTKISLLLAGLVSNCFSLAVIHLLYYLFGFGLFDSLMLSFVCFLFFFCARWVSFKLLSRCSDTFVTLHFWFLFV